jgi:hypothetical protein
MQRSGAGCCEGGRGGAGLTKSLELAVRACRGAACRGACRGAVQVPVGFRSGLAGGGQRCWEVGFMLYNGPLGCLGRTGTQVGRLARPSRISSRCQVARLARKVEPTSPVEIPGPTRRLVDDLKTRNSSD